MNWAQLIAALAACGGLRSGPAVDAAMREAAAPERDFRQLIDVVRAAISEQINNGRLPEQRRYVSLSAIYSDRAVIELDGKHFQYSYSFKHIAGTDQVVLGAPIEVVEQYVPTAPVAAPAPVPAATTAVAAAVREALGGDADHGAFREAADGSIEVTLIRSGRSGTIGAEAAIDCVRCTQPGSPAGIDDSAWLVQRGDVAREPGSSFD